MPVEGINHLTDKVNKMTDTAEAMMAETRLQFDTLIAMQSDERKEMRHAFHEEKEKMRKHYGRIIAGLILTLVIILGAIIGGAVYIFSNFEFASYEQVATVGGDGTYTIFDGIHHGIAK